MRRLDLKIAILVRMATRALRGVWTPREFLDFGSREAVDQALRRLARNTALKQLSNESEPW